MPLSTYKCYFKAISFNSDLILSMKDIAMGNIKGPFKPSSKKTRGWYCAVVYYLGLALSKSSHFRYCKSILQNFPSNNSPTWGFVRSSLLQSCLSCSFSADCLASVISAFFNVWFFFSFFCESQLAQEWSNHSAFGLMSAVDDACQVILCRFQLSWEQDVLSELRPFTDFWKLE